MDQLMHGASGAGGLAGHLHAHFRNFKKRVDLDVTGARTAEVSKELHDNP
jgi:hypothetical protein